MGIWSSVVDTFFDRVAHGDRIAALNRGYGDADGRLAVDTAEYFGRVHVIAPDGGHVSEVDQSAALAGDEQIPEILFRFELTGGIDGDVFGADLILPASAARFLACRAEDLAPG